MKTAPGSPKTGQDILGREKEVADLQRLLTANSVVFTAERRVGKSCVLEKLVEQPPDGTAAIMCLLEAKRHPFELVREITSQAQKHAVLSRRSALMSGFLAYYEKLGGVEADGWHLPEVQRHWKELLGLLVEDFVERGKQRIILVLDELPHMLDSIIGDGNAPLAMELLDTIRELQHRYQASGKFRFLITGSIGLHLIVTELKLEHGYKGNPTNAMASMTLSGMSLDDVELMCRKYLDEEGISRTEPELFYRKLHRITDGLPLYVEYICDRFQAAERKTLAVADIDREARDLLDSSEVQWFWDAAERIDTHYKRLGLVQQAVAILAFLCRQPRSASEDDILGHLKSLGSVEDEDQIRCALELLRRDHYLQRTIYRGQRRYAFQYSLMRRWWSLNKG